MVSRAYIKTVGYQEVGIRVVKARLTAIHKFAKEDWVSLQESTSFVKSDDYFLSLYIVYLLHILDFSFSSVYTH